MTLAAGTNLGPYDRRLHLLGGLPFGHRVAARPDADSTATLVSELRSGSRGASRFARLLPPPFGRRSLLLRVCLRWSGRETWSRRERS